MIEKKVLEHRSTMKDNEERVNNSYNAIVHGFINVFNVWPDFLLPIFKDKDENSIYYFQKEADKHITDFVIANPEDFFKHSFIVKATKFIKLKVGDHATYAVGFNENDCFIGTIDEVIEHYKKNKNKYEKNEDFFESFSEFLKKYDN